jgi:cytochrome c oxidase subunit 2
MSPPSRTSASRWILAALLGASLPAPDRAALAPTATAQATRREFHVVVRRYAFDPAVIEVQQDDLVRIVLEAVDIPHSFTVDRYRIAKRANPGQPVTFEFHAREAGEFPIYCNLTLDERCPRETRGRLVVRPRD